MGEHIVVRDFDLSTQSDFWATDADKAPHLAPITAIDMSGARLSTLSRLGIQEFDVGVRVEPPALDVACLNWIESCQIGCIAPVSLGDNAEDCTIWSGQHSLSGQRSPTKLFGVNNHFWFGVIEPQTLDILPEQGQPYEFSEVELGGYGSGIFAMHIEGHANPSVPSALAARGGLGPDDRYDVVRIREGSTLCSVSFSHLAQEGGIPVSVDVDSAAALVRFAPSRKVGISTQPVFDAGMTNLLVNSTFADASPFKPGIRWGVPDAAARLPVEFDRMTGEADVRALDAALRVRVAAAGGLVLRKAPQPMVVLSQLLVPGDNLPLRTAADKTFAAGCWIRGPSRGPGVWLRLTEVGSGGKAIRSAESNEVVGSGWRFASLHLHTTTAASAVRLDFVATPGADFVISEPIVVEGLYLPPWHARPLPDCGGTIFAPFVPGAFTEEVRLSHVGALPPGSEGLARPLAVADLVEGGRVRRVFAAILQPDAGEEVRCWIRVEKGGQLADVPTLDPIVFSPGAASMPSPWQCSVDVPSAPAVRGGTRFRLHAAVYRRGSGMGAAPLPSPRSRDIALTIGLAVGV